MRNQIWLAAIAALAVTTPAVAQDGYLFGTPRLSATLRVGAAAPAAQGAVYDFITEQLTLDRSDFASVTVGGDLSVRLLPQLDFLLSVATSQSSDVSEFRDFVETNDEPIRQETKLIRTPLTAGLKVHLLPRGRSISRYAYVPNRFSPYVGGGAGIMWYRLEQEGDFVDFETLDIFTDYFEDSGETFTANAFAGGDIWVLPRVGLNVEGRYNWAKADLKSDYADFGQIDLKGWQLTAGVTFRY